MDSQQGLQLFDASTGKQIQTLTRGGAHRPLECADFSTGESLVAAAIERRIHIWDIKTGELLDLLPTHRHSFVTLQFSADSMHLISLDTRTTIEVWSYRENDIPYIVDERMANASTSGLAVSKDGQRVAVGIPQFNRLNLWDATTFTSHEKIELGESYRHAAVSGIARRVAFAKRSEGVEVIDWLTRNPIFQWRGSSVARVTLSPDGNQLAARSGKLKRTPVEYLRFNPDGKLLASASGRFIDLYDVRGQKLIKTLYGHDGRVTALSFSPDGRRLATSSFDNTVRIWDVSTGQEMLTLRGHESNVENVAFSADGQTVFSKSPDRVITWRAPRE